MSRCPLSDSAKHTATLTRVSFVSYDLWDKTTAALHPTSRRYESLVHDVEYATVEGEEAPVALWHDEYQMGYIALCAAALLG